MATPKSGRKGGVAGKLVADVSVVGPVGHLPLIGAKPVFDHLSLSHSHTHIR